MGRSFADNSNWEQQNISRGGCFCQQEGANRSSLRASRIKLSKRIIINIRVGLLGTECAIM